MNFWYWERPVEEWPQKVFDVMQTDATTQLDSRLRNMPPMRTHWAQYEGHSLRNVPPSHASHDGTKLRCSCLRTRTRNQYQLLANDDSPESLQLIILGFLCKSFHFFDRNDIPSYRHQGLSHMVPDRDPRFAEIFGRPFSKHTVWAIPGPDGDPDVALDSVSVPVGERKRSSPHHTFTEQANVAYLNQIRSDRPPLRLWEEEFVEVVRRR